MNHLRTQLIGVDIGSSSIKASVITANGEIVFRSKVPLPVIADHGFKEIKLEDLWRAFVESIRALHHFGADLSQVIGLGIASQMAGFVLLDSNHQAVRNAILGVDQRGIPFIPRLTAKMGSEFIYSHTGCPVTGIYPTTKWLWTLENEAEHAKEARYMGGIKEYLLWRLTSQWVTDPATASTTQLYHQKNKHWWTDLINELQLSEEMLPVILNPDELAGYLNGDAAEELQLPSGLPISVGTGDGPASNLSTASVSGKELCISLGTTAVTRFLTKHPMQLDAGKPYFQQHFGWDCYFQGSRVERAGSYIEMFLGSDHTETDSVNDSQPHLFFNVFAKKDNDLFIGSDIHPNASKKMNTVLEGILFGLFHVMEPVIFTHAFEDIRPIGGGATNLKWLQDMADLFQLPVKITKVSDCTLGAAMLISKTVGCYDSWQSASQAMNEITNVITPDVDRSLSIRNRYETYSSIIRGGRYA